MNPHHVTNTKGGCTKYDNRSDTTKKARATRRYVICAVAVVGTGGMSVTAVPNAGAATGIPNLSYKGTITMYAASYDPPIAGYKQRRAQ